MESLNTPSVVVNNTTINSSYKSIDEQLKLIKIAIDNTLVIPDLAIPLEKRGYDNAAMQAATELFIKANNLHVMQKEKYGSKYEAKDEFDSLKDNIDSDYDDHSALAKISFKNDRGTLEKLQLNGKRKRDISGWLGQIKAFYFNALSSDEIKAALAKKGISEEELLTAKANIDTLEKKEAAKYDAKGEAQNATVDRDNALNDLIEWYKDFTETSKVAFKKTPQLLEKLGISV